MTDKTTEALKLAEEALQDALSGWTYIQQSHGQLYGVGWERVDTKGNEALAAIREALAEPVKQEPVAWMWQSVDIESRSIETGLLFNRGVDDENTDWIPLYAAPVSAPKHKPIPFGQPGSREGFPPLEPLETLAYPLKECRHCGWLCTPNSGQLKKFYPLSQEPVAYKYKESSPETGEFVFAAPVDAKTIRAEALEEAAKVCEQDEFQIWETAERVAAAIRARVVA